MTLKLNIYTDETMTAIKRVCEADKLKIPYRVAMYLMESLDKLSLDNEDELLKFVASNANKMDKILKATFGVADSELDCIDAGELIETIKELFNWGLEKMSSLKGDEKNLQTPVTP